ncbi:MAG: hypothetical protein R2681_09250 [Pyrinomonadaceae bacterium]
MSEHNKVEIDSEKAFQNVELSLDKPYEEDVISFRGILYFGAGLFLLIVITFGLMWIFQFQVLAPDAEEKAAQVKRDNPLMLSEDEKLPPEPRLQSAPGFGVDSKNGRISLELREPQAEWHELQKQYKDIWENGEKSSDGKTVVALPIKEAKEKLLKDGNVKSATGPEAEKAYTDARHFVSGSSAGRLASEKRK